MKHFFTFLSLLALLLTVNVGWGQTPYLMSSGTYNEEFINISNTTNWPNNFNGTDSQEWAAVPTNSSGTIGDGIRITVSTATFSAGTTGGVQRGNENIYLLSTSTANACAIDLLLNFTGRNAGTISFDVATVFNSTGDRDSRLKLFYSTDGINFTELSGTNLPYTARNNVAGSASIIGIALPSDFNNSSTARLRFYNHSTTFGATPTGSQPKISIDNIVVTSTASNTPLITVGSITGFGNQTVNTTSSEKSYSVTGANLTENITVTPPAGFKASTTTGSGYTSDPISLPPSGGNVYVVFNPTAVQAYSGNITHNSTGADSKNVAVSGTGVSPANPATFTATAASTSQINLAATANGNANDIVVVHNGTGTFSVPTDGIAPGAVGESFSGGTIHYKGAAGSLTNHTGLSSNQAVYYKAYSYDALNFYSTGSTANATTLLNEPTNHVVTFSATANSSSQITVNWTDATGGQLPSAYLVKAAIAPATPTAPVDGTPESDGTLIKIISQGTQQAVFTGLNASTTYNFAIWPYTNSGADINYKTDGSIPSASAITNFASSTSDYFRSKASGNWNAVGTWESSANGSDWHDATLTPTSSANTITIRNGHEVTVTASVTIDQTTIDSGGQISVNPSVTMTIADGAGTDLVVSGILSNQGTISFSSGSTGSFNENGTYYHARDGLGGNITNSTSISWDVNSNLNVTGWVTSTSNTTFSSSVTYGNFNWNSTSQTNTYQASGSIANIGGAFTLTSTGSGILRLNSTDLTLNVVGDFIINGGTLQLSNNSTGTYILNLGGSMSMSGGTFSPNISSSILSFNFSGLNKTFTQTSGTLTNVNINWRINEGASLSLNNDLPVAANRTLTVGGGTSGTLNMGTNAVSGAGTITTASGSTLKTAHTSGINGNLTVSTKNLNPATNFIFNGTTDQVTGSLITSAGNITLENTAGMVSLSNSLAISGTLTIPNGTKLDAASYVLSGTGNVAVQSGGTFITSHASGLNANNTTSGGSSSYSTSANYEFNASGAQISGSFLPTTVNNLATSETSQLTISNSGLLTVSNNLTLGTGTSLQVGHDQSLTISGTLTNSGTLTIKSDATGTGSLIHSNSGVSAIAERYVVGHANAAADGWHLMGSPVATFDINGSSFDPGANDDLYSWDEATNTWLNHKAGNPTQIVPGTGYLVAYESTATKSFTGNLNVSNVSVSGLTHNASQGKGWHLLGNPFASALEWNKTGGSWALTNIAATAKVWNSGSKAYDDIVANGIIPAAQGFFVQVNESTTGSLTIPAAARAHSGTAWYKSTTPRILLSASPADGSSKQESQIRIEPEATTGFDFYHDSRFLEGYAPKFYSVSGGEMLSTNALPQLQDGTSIPFGFVKNQHNAFVIRLEENMPATDIYLKDLKLNLAHHLSQQTEYYFTAAQGDEPNRFLLHFGVVGITEKPSKPALHAYVAAGQLHLLNLHGTAQLEIFDLSGRLLQQHKVVANGKQSVPLALPAGVYVVLATGETNSEAVKVIVQ